uniref:Uncharacterized protein n=1 Tax=Anguilla anguilla TaxID=7936 RepID=A0A0E9U9S0_ANGAN
MCPSHARNYRIPHNLVLSELGSSKPHLMNAGQRNW